MERGALWIQDGRGRRGTIVIVTNGELQQACTEAAGHGFLTIACTPAVARAVLDAFRTDALVLAEDLSWMECTAVALAFSAVSRGAPILRCGPGHPGGMESLISEFARTDARPLAAR